MSATALKIVKFFTSSLLATAVDFLLYALLISALAPAGAHLLSASVGMLINYVLQLRWVFRPSRGVVTSFLLSLLFSLGGIALGTLIIYALTTWTPLAAFPLPAKIITTGLVFTYNYLTKKIAFGDH